jgi:kinetochore protein Spc24
MFNAGPDKLAIGRISESLSTLREARELRIREAESALKSNHTSAATPDVASICLFC